MTREQAFERLRQANPAPDDNAPDEFLSQMALLERIDARSVPGLAPVDATDAVDRSIGRRRDMQTREHPVEAARDTRRERPQRRLAPALVAAIAVIVVGAGVWALTRSDVPVANRSPLEVADQFNQLVATGDWEAGRALYAEGATYQINWSGQEGEVIVLSDPFPEDAGVPDWDGDGVVTNMDAFDWLGSELYAAGTTSFLVCTQPDATTAVCDEMREGFAFPSSTHSATWTITTNDAGLVTSIVIEGRGEGTSSGLVADYSLWLVVNHPELEDELLDGFGTLRLTPDTVDTHRQMVAEWQAQR